MEMLEKNSPRVSSGGHQPAHTSARVRRLRTARCCLSRMWKAANTLSVPALQMRRLRADHYHRYKEDIRLFKELGMKSYRFSIAWSRIIPDGNGEINEKGVAFYRALIDECIANGIEPIVTLYHYDLPMALVEKYDGWISRQSVKDFERYARFVIETFKDKVKYWLTIKEHHRAVLGSKEHCARRVKGQ